MACYPPISLEFNEKREVMEEVEQTKKHGESRSSGTQTLGKIAGGYILTKKVNRDGGSQN